MSGDALGWTFDLIDRISGPAGEMERSLGKLPLQLEEVERGIKELEKVAKLDAFAKQTDPLKKQQMALQLIKDELSGVAGAEKKGAESTGLLGFEIGAMIEITHRAIDAIVELGRKVVDLGIEFVKTTLDQSEFKRGMISSLSILVGGASEAEKALAAVELMSKRAGVSADRTGEAFRLLLGTGFQIKEAQDIIAASLDVGAQLGGGAKGQEAAERVEQMLTRIRTLGKLDSRELVEFGTLGIQPEKIYDAIAKAKGITSSAAKQLAEAGSLGAQDSITAILSAIQNVNDEGAALGTRAMAHAAGSVPAQFQIIKNLWGNLFEDIDTTGIAKSLSRIAELFAPDSPTGARATALFTKIFGTLSDGLDKLTSGDGMANALNGLLSFGEGALDAFHASLPYLQAFGKALTDVIGPTVDQLAPVFKAIFGGDAGPSPLLLDAFRAFGMSLAFTVTGIMNVVAAIGLMADGFFGITGVVLDVLDAIHAAGASPVDGLWAGITEGWDAMLGKFEGLIGQLPASVKKVLGIASPSKVMMELGFHTADGFRLGMESAGLDGDPVAPPAMPVAPGAAPPDFSNIQAPGGGGGRAISISIGDIHLSSHMTGNDNADEKAGELASAFKAKLTSTLEEIAMEYGVAAP